MNSIEILNKGVETLTLADCETPRLDAEILLTHALSCERHELYTNTSKCQPLTGQFELFKTYIERRAKREPVAYIIGYKEFWSLKIKVTPAVLIPRPETEMVVEKALELLDHGPWTMDHGPTIILDLCTGSGCIAAALAKERPGVKIVVTDISKEALNIAKENLNFAKDRVTIIQSDLFERVTGKFDLIVSNPPYIPAAQIDKLAPEIAQFEPRLALNGGADGLDFVAQIRQDAFQFLKPEGSLILENGPEVEIVSAAGFTPAKRKGCGGMGPSLSKAKWGSDPPE